MNILDLLTSLLPLSSAALGLITALTSAIITRKLERKIDNDIQNVLVKVNDREFQIEGLNETEVIKLLEKLNAEKPKNNTTNDSSESDVTLLSKY